MNLTIHCLVDFKENCSADPLIHWGGQLKSQFLRIVVELIRLAFPWNLGEGMKGMARCKVNHLSVLKKN